ncbi:hypothetical protein C0V78_09525 [Novosphingobium sp. TH158]|nr:hypothetical protein C0V78_09525 [Novosphingobium sp. TH158]
MITPEAVESALKDCAPPIVSGKDWEWLAMAVRRSLASTMQNVSDSPDRTSNAAICRELVGLCEQISGAYIALQRRSNEADMQLWNVAFKQWKGVNALAADDDPDFDYNRFERALADLKWLGEFVGHAAVNTKQQKANWRTTERKLLRVERGHCLARVYESAFGIPITVNNWPSGMHRAPSPFMEFYQKMVALAFGERATPDLAGILKLARRRHLSAPYAVSEGEIPGL